MDFIDLKAQQKLLESDINARISTVLSHGKYIMGPEVKELEATLANYVGVKYVISCSSGTDALLMGLMALGIGAGDAVITTPFTFIATAEAIAMVGATPLFVDIDEKTFNIDSSKIEAAIEEAKSKGLIVKAIIPVDLFGLPADYDAVCKVAKEHDLFVIEDGCQGFGGEYKGAKACSFGDVAATSFFPAKPLGCYGDGGAIFTNSDELADKLRSIRVHGQGADKYNNIRLGINGRMDTIQAAILLSKISIFSGEVESRQQVAAWYSDALSGLVETPTVPEGYLSAWAQYTIRVNDRKAVQAKLGMASIPSAIYYPKPLHLQDAYDYLGYKMGDFPVSEGAATEVLSLPMHPYMTKEQVSEIAAAIRG